jgi:hypothetical protein
MSATTDADRASANEANRMIREIADKIIGNRRLRLAAYRQPGPGQSGSGSPRTYQDDHLGIEIKEGVRWV